MSQKLRMYLWLTATLLFMMVIWFKSSEPYQQQDLRPFLADWIPLSLLQSWLPRIEFFYDKDFLTWRQPYDMLEFFIRKGAHVMEFGLLTFLWLRTLSCTLLSRCKVLLLSAGIPFLYAVLDEWHQTFVPGRTGHAIDVGVDSIGILVTTILYLFVVIFRQK